VATGRARKAGQGSSAAGIETGQSKAGAAHLSPDERVARGKAARSEVPRASHGEWEPSSDRPDPIALLEQQAVTRVPELVPIRYGRMLVSPFAFFRGAALIMAADLAPTPRSGIDAQICGDAHLSNFGVFGTPERRFSFDLNDFDETHPGPWEWDVKRLAASIAVAGRERGFSPKQRRGAELAATAGYRTAMRDFAGMRNLDVWYSHLDVDQLPEPKRTKRDADIITRTEAALAKARTRDSMRAFSKLTELVDGEPRIISDPPLIVPIEELVDGIERDQLRDYLRSMFRDYQETLSPDRRRLLEQYQVVHFARKVVGVGSVGTRAWIALLLGRDLGDPLFLQMKEAEPSVLEPFVGPSVYANHGERVVAGQRLMQAASDTFLGWQRVERGLDGRQRDFYIRQLHDWKGSANIEEAVPEEMALYGELCGRTLARAHARSGDRIAIAAYLGRGAEFDEAIASFAESYAGQNDRDYQALVAAVEAGRVVATTGL
jgi:uncharacterized protein (DUF2252 family)